MLESQWVWQCTKSVNIPAEEQNAGLIVDYFYRMEFHITPRFFSDSNYLFFFFFCDWGGAIKVYVYFIRRELLLKWPKNEKGKKKKKKSLLFWGF